MKNTYLLLILFLCSITLSAQTPYTLNLSAPVTSGTYTNTAGIINSTQQISGTANVTYLAGHEIHLTDGFSATGTFTAKIEDILSVADMIGNWAPIQWSRFEMGINLPDISPDNLNTNINTFLTTGTGGINPYNPDQIKIQCDFTDQNGKTYTRYGFFFVDFPIGTIGGTTFTGPDPDNPQYDQSLTNYPFRIRFAPPVLGNYTFNFKVYLNGTLQTYPAYQCSGTFTCQGDVGYSTPLSMGGQNNAHLQDAHGNMFFAMGRNIPFAEGASGAYAFATQQDFAVQQNRIQNLKNAGGNWVRVRMDPWSNDVEWEQLGVYGSNIPVGNSFQRFYRQWQAKEFDQTLFQLEDFSGMYMFLTLLEDQTFLNPGAIGYISGSGWPNNPYNNSALGVTTQWDFITSSTAQAQFKKRLFYIMARWGYSSNIGVISLINETDGFPGYGSNPSDMLTWQQTMATYLKSFYPQHLLTSGYANVPQIPDDGAGGGNFHFLTHNNYSSARNSIAQRHDVATSVSFPYIWGELGTNTDNCSTVIDECTDIETHNAIWSTSMNSNAIGTGMYWNDWEDINGVQHENNFTALKAFFVDNVAGNSPAVTNTFASDTWSSKWYCDISVSVWKYPPSRKVEWIFNLNNPVGVPATKAYGWVHNTDCYWINMQGSGCSLTNDQNTCADPDDTHDSGGQDLTDHDHNYGSPQHPVSITLSGFQASNVTAKYFFIEQYSCYGTGGLISTNQVTSSIIGTITIPNFTVGGYLGDTYGDPDYAFKIYKSDITFRQTATNNTPSDTIHVNPANPCIQATGYMDEAIKGTHKWDFGNGTSSNQESPLVCYTSPGTYSVTHSFTDTSGKNINIHSNVTILYQDTSTINQTNSRIVNRDNTVLLYPNPFTNGFTIKAQKIIAEIAVKNTLGVEVGKIANINEVSTAFIISPNNVAGMFFVSIKFADGEFVTKVITKQ
ncbi:MAG: 3-coathanger stack domain-containing protein [Bacteroidia bacterium]